MLAVSIALTTSTILTATSNTRNVKFPYYTYYYKSYYTKEKCQILYPYLKQQAKARKGRRGLSNKKRKTYKDNDELDNPIGLITYFRITANNNTGNLLYT